MPRGYRDVLATLRERLDALESELADEERDEREAETREEEREAAASVKELRAEISELRAELRGRAEPESEPEPEPESEPEGEDELSERRTRPGRKKGMLYQYDVDGSGAIVELDLPTVYGGDDEPDEVELPPDVEPELEETG